MELGFISPNEKPLLEQEGVPASVLRFHTDKSFLSSETIWPALILLFVFIRFFVVLYFQGNHLEKFELIILFLAIGLAVILRAQTFRAQEPDPIPEAQSSWTKEPVLLQRFFKKWMNVHSSSRRGRSLSGWKRWKGWKFNQQNLRSIPFI